MRKSYDMPKQWYDTEECIRGSLISLEAFLQLIEARAEAGYDRRERLKEFYVLGRFYLDSCGNCGKITENAPKENFANIPDVLTREAFWSFLKKNARSEKYLRITSGMNSELPPMGIVCPVCGKGWDIHNCYDTVVERKTPVLPLDLFAGRTLEELKAHLAKAKSARYFMQQDIMIRNEKNIELGHKDGWLNEADGINDRYVIREGDQGYFNVWTYRHQKCHRRYLKEQNEEEFRKLFLETGFQSVGMQAIANEYSKDSLRPWFKVTTECGVFVIGWRARVISISWSRLVLKEIDAEVKPWGPDLMHLFPETGNTKGATYIHAYGYEETRKFLKKIHAYLSAQTAK